MRQVAIALALLALTAGDAGARGRLASLRKASLLRDAAFHAVQLRARRLRARPGTSRRFADLRHAARAYSRHRGGTTRIVLSPHLDDAVLSLGGSIATWRAAGDRVLVVTFATGAPPPGAPLSKVARGMHRQWKLPSHRVASVRRAEDVRALGRLGADLVHIGDVDGLYRGALYPGWVELASPPHADDPMRASVAGAIDVLSSELPDAVFYAPLAVGDHVDHALVHQEAMKRAAGIHLRFYEDLPYTATRPGALERRLAHLSLEPETLHLDRRALARKLDAAAAYDSQIEALFGHRLAMRRTLRRHAARVSGKRRTHAERVWRPSTRLPE